ncbi:hypothetical protein [Acrocarpospora sp. B8E8]|uniref:hypothetical protein n=1 Tax=Acrocarpospora sp. B8E8 TaxID=3153572 RepID=UPI00325E2BD0
MDTLMPLLFVAAVIFILYMSAIRNPLRTCPRCKGAGTLPALIPGRFRPCPRCGRKGETRAWFGRPE